MSRKKRLEQIASERQMQELGVFVHGVLFGFHSLGVVYNARRGRWVDTAIHTATAVYDLVSAIKHTKYLSRTEKYVKNEYLNNPR